jgi:hypothetical protein
MTTRAIAIAKALKNNVARLKWAAPFFRYKKEQPKQFARSHCAMNGATVEPVVY